MTIWGSGQVRQEFLHADDVASAGVFLFEHHDEPVNVGAGTDVLLVKLANLVRDVIAFEGRIIWDTSKPDGVPRRLLNSRELNELGGRRSGWRRASAGPTPGTCSRPGPRHS